MSFSTTFTENVRKYPDKIVLEFFNRYELFQSPHDKRRIGSVGPPLPGVEVRVVDSESTAILPDGEIRDIQLRGLNVFNGYWRQPKKTPNLSQPTDDSAQEIWDLGNISDKLSTLWYNL